MGSKPIDTLPKPKFLDQLRLGCLKRNYSPRMASCYVCKCHQFFLLHKSLSKT